MRKFIRGDTWMFVVGAALLLWGVMSAFSEQRHIQAMIQASQDGETVITPGPGTTGDVSQAPGAPASPLASSTVPQGEAPTVGPSASPTGTPSTGDDVFLPQASPIPTQPVPPLIPDRIVIPAIKLDAPIKEVALRYMKLDNTPGVFQQWTVPDEYAAGWLPVTAPLGVPGNTVLDGHHNVWGEVFGHLVDLKPGDRIFIYSGEAKREYMVTNRMILPERDEPISVRLENARWLLPSSDERLTLVTCWPHWTNTHRLIIVAAPVGWVVPPS